MTINGAVPERSLHPRPKRRWLTGMGVLLSKELGAWWNTRRWWLHALLWLGVMNGLLALIYPVISGIPEATRPEDELPMGLQLARFFFSIGGTAVAAGALVSGQDAIIGERQSGTAAWVLSKPVSRTAFVLAKFIAHTVSLSVLAVVLQAAVAYGQIWGLTNYQLRPHLFLTGVGLLVLHLVFFIAMTLFLGALSRSRPPVLLVGLGWLFGAPLLAQMVPSFARFAPIGLPDQAVALLMGMPFQQLPSTPISLTAGLAAVFVVGAAWLFEREEL